MIEPQQGLTYAEQLAIAKRAEAAGFEHLFRSDHYQSFPGPSGEPTTDAWAVLAGLAGNIPLRRQSRQGRNDGRRDERRADRAWPRGGLERRGAPSARPAISGNR